MVNLLKRVPTTESTKRQCYSDTNIKKIKLKRSPWMSTLQLVKQKGAQLT